MILRAAFWIALVAVFIPREPDLGYGRPSVPGFLSAKMTDWMSDNLKASASVCEERNCAGRLALADDLRGTILSNLDRVKAELKQSEPARPDQRRQIGSDLAAYYRLLRN